MKLFDANAPIVDELAKKHGVDARLVRAIVEVESGWNMAAVRYEEGYRWTVPFHKEPCSVGTERFFQRCSIGLMQLMGANYRAMGYEAAFLTDLFYDPALQLEYGVRYLRKMIAANKTIAEAIAAWNGGTARRVAPGGPFENQEYVDRVASAFARFGGKM